MAYRVEVGVRWVRQRDVLVEWSHKVLRGTAGHKQRKDREPQHWNLRILVEKRVPFNPIRVLHDHFEN